MKNTYIVIGASAAGIGVLSKLRSLDSTADIICISSQKELPYNTCLLADFLAHRKEESSIFTKGLDFFEKNHIKLILGALVTKLYKDTSEIEVNYNYKLKYTKLFLGLGTTLYFPKINMDSDMKGIFGFHTLNDTYNILNFVKNNDVKNATIIGAGLSGVECSDSLAACGIKVNLIEMQSRILPLSIDQEGSLVIENLMPYFGVTFYPNTTVLAIKSKDHITKQITLSTNKKIETDMIIFATGAKPNVKLALSSGIDSSEQGIRVNEFMQTSDPNIFAGGDVAIVKNLIDGKFVRSTMWPDAMQQGMIAAHAMTSQPKVYPGVCIIASSNFYNTTFVSCGEVINPLSDSQIIIRKEAGFYHKFILKEGRLTGFLMVGNVQNLGELRRNIISKEIINTEKLIF